MCRWARPLLFEYETARIPTNRGAYSSFGCFSKETQLRTDSMCTAKVVDRPFMPYLPDIAQHSIGESNLIVSCLAAGGDEAVVPHPPVGGSRLILLA